MNQMSEEEIMELPDEMKQKLSSITKVKDLFGFMKSLDDSQRIAASHYLSNKYIPNNETVNIYDYIPLIKWFTAIQDSVNDEKAINEKAINKISKLLNSEFETIEEFEKKFKVLTKKPTRKFKQPTKKDHASMPTSLLNNEIIKAHNLYKIESGKAISKSSQSKIGCFSIAEQIEKSSLEKSELLEKYKYIGITREEYQVYLAVLNVYTQNMSQKDITDSKPYELDIHHFHSKVLKRKNRLRKEDLERYSNIFKRLASKWVCYTVRDATIKPYNSKKMRYAKCECPLIHASITTYDDYKNQIVKIIPSDYTILELKTIGHISNYLPWDFIELGFDKSDNVFYFGLYLVTMHKNNSSRKEDKKIIKNKTCGWEVSMKTLVEKALPNGKELIEQYEKTEHKTQFTKRHITKPLLEAFEILKKHKYILKHTKDGFIYKNAFDEGKNKISCIFNYDL